MNFDNYSLRPITKEDTEGFFQLVENNRERISMYFPGIVKLTNTVEETRAHITERITVTGEGKYMPYLIIDKSTGLMIGVVQLKDIDFNAGKREFGFFIDRHHTGKGIATKSILTACDYCFNTLHLNKIFMRIAEENISSRRVAEKCGFMVEGIMREDFMTSEGKLINLHYYGLLKSEFVKLE